MMTVEALHGAKDGETVGAMLKDILHFGQYDLDSPWFKSETNYPYYPALARIVRPRSVLETGVRYGYSLLAFLRGHPGVSEIVGLDDESNETGSQHMAAENLRAAGYCGTLFLPIVDALGAMGAMGAGLFDLVHLDDSASRKRVSMEIAEGWKCLKPGGVLIVDNARAPGVWKAVEESRGSMGLGEGIYFDSLKGWWLAEKK